MNAYIIGTGSYVPERVVSNEELSARLGIAPERIFKSSGIMRRHWADPGTTTSTLAFNALRLALKDSQVSPVEIDYLLVGTMTPDRFVPGCAPAIQKAAGLQPIPCLDIRAACCNALYALQIACSLIRGRAARTIAICLAEIQSAFLDLSPTSGTLSMLFGDGAAALIVSANPRPAALEILDVQLFTAGEYTDDLGIRRPGTQFGASRSNGANQVTDFAPRMNGQTIILQAGRRMVAAGRSVLNDNNVSTEEVRWLVPHQANANLLAQVARELTLSPPGCEVVSVIEETGNTSSASMGLALDELRRSRRVRAGDYLLLPAFAAGFTWGAALCRGS